MPADGSLPKICPVEVKPGSQERLQAGDTYFSLLTSNNSDDVQRVARPAGQLLGQMVNS